jgi:ferredoxin
MNSISRRDLFRSVFGRRTGMKPASEGGQPASHDDASPSQAPGWKHGLHNSQDGCSPPLALILDRFCLAYQGSFCSVCSERCPELGAIIVTQGKPRVNPDRCTGCRICHDVCPAPKNAVFLVARKPRQGMVARAAEPDIP